MLRSLSGRHRDWPMMLWLWRSSGRELRRGELETAWRRAICFAQFMKAKPRQLLYARTAHPSDECLSEP